MWKLSFPRKVSLILFLFVQAALFVDYVNFIVHICDIKINIYIYIYIYIYILFSAGKNSKVTSVLNFIPIKFRTLPQGVLKVLLHFGLNVYTKSSRDSLFATNSLFVDYTWSQTRPISCTNLIFPGTFIKVFTQYQLETTCTIDGFR